MGLEDILAAMEADAAAEREAILSSAKQEAEQIVARAREAAVTARSRAAEAELRRLRSDQARRLNDARLGGLREVAAAREQLLEGSFAACVSELQSIRSSPGYETTLGQLLDEALDEIGDHAVSVQVDPRDEGIVRRLLSDRGVSAHLSPCLGCAGGLDLASEDGRIVVRNTLERRLGRAREMLREELLSMLEGGRTEHDRTSIVG
jgi:V/A-type H+/Na+-transporting ATPase subunit E